jgi:outer membrane protein assembly factor BamB
VYAFSRRGGKLLWKQDKLLHRGVTGPAVLGNVVIVADAKGYVHFLSANDGRFLARTYPDGNGVLSSPVAAGNGVYVYTNSGRLVKYQF